MQTKLVAIAALCVASAFCSAQAMTKDEYKAAKDKIEASYKADKKACDSLKSNANDVCVKEAKGKEKVAKAELEQGYKPSDRNMRKVNEAKADTAYDVAKEKCEDQKGAAEKTCKSEAKATHNSAIKAVKAKA
ncbi:MAG: hypothetical protein ABIN37_08770 [Burkholderiaceae bacterium]